MPTKPRKIVSAQGRVAMANHCAIVSLLRIVNRCSLFSTPRSLGPIGLFARVCLRFGSFSECLSSALMHVCLRSFALANQGKTPGLT